MKPVISVIIPVYNDAKRLRLCLDALSKQTYPKDHFEIVIVDNGSNDDIDAVVLPHNAKLLRASTPGPAAARNVGLHAAQGDILAFTDADCVPQLDWLERGVEELTARPRAGFIGGKIDFFFKGEKPTLIESYDELLYLKQEQYMSKAKFAITANIFMLKRVADEIGDFNENLISAEDVEWTRRVFDSRNGYVPVYVQTVVVRHPARVSLGALVQRARKIAGGGLDRMAHVDKTLFAHLKRSLIHTYMAKILEIGQAHLPLEKKIVLWIIETFLQGNRIYEIVLVWFGKRPVRFAP